MADHLSGFPVIKRVEVAWGEMDAFSHVNNIMYFRYFESARIAYFERVQLMEFMAETGIGPILASTSCRFKMPVTFPDTLQIGAKVVDVQKDRFSMRYRVVSEKTGRIAAEGEGSVVCYDYTRNAKSDVPEVMLARINELEQL